MANADSFQTFRPTSSLKWLFFDLNSFFASVEQQENPALRGKPVAVVPMITDSTCAIAASYEAKAYGIKTGTKIYDAKQLCPNLKLVLARHDIYTKYHYMIMDEVERHIPITKTCSIDEAACALCENESSTDYIYDLVTRIKAGLRQNIGEAVTCSIGIAQNAFLAKIASDVMKPDGLVIFEPNNYKEILFSLKLSDLTGIGLNMERRLHESGIHTVEQFWNISPKHARKIWNNVTGEQFWYRLHGYEVPQAETKKSVVGHSRVLDPDHRAPPKAFMIAQQLTIKAASRLRTYGLYARRFSLSVRSTGGRHWAHESSFSPTQDNFTFIKSLERLWQSMLYTLEPEKLKKVSINIYDLYHSNQVTLDLFESAANEKPLQHSDVQKLALSSAMDSLNQRYKSQVVTIGRPPKTKAGHVGTKIAFTRIPAQDEFIE